MSNSVYILQYFLLFHSICFNLFMHIIPCPSTSPLLYPSIHLPICMSLHHFPSTYRVSPSKVSLFYVIFYFTLCSHCTHVVGTLRCCCLRECCQMVFIICVCASERYLLPVASPTFPTPGLSALDAFKTYAKNLLSCCV